MVISRPGPREAASSRSVQCSLAGEDCYSMGNRPMPAPKDMDVGVFVRLGWVE
jgi:hypothetical protein